MSDRSSITAVQDIISTETAGIIRSKSQTLLEALADNENVIGREYSVNVLLTAILERLDRLEDNAGYGPVEESYLALQDILGTLNDAEPDTLPTFGDLYPEVQDALLNDDGGDPAEGFFEDQSPCALGIDVSRTEEPFEDTEEEARWSSATGQPLNYTAIKQDEEEEAKGFDPGDWVEFYALDGDVQDFLINEAVDQVVGALYDVSPSGTASPVDTDDEYALRRATELTSAVSDSLLAELEDEIRHLDYVAGGSQD